VTPDQHAARAEELVRDADEAFQEATNDWHGEDRRWQGLYREITAISTLAQVHATLALRRGPQPEEVVSLPEDHPGDRYPDSGIYPRDDY
jgi:hypothetical protein